MQDRIVQFPNRYMLEPVDGSSPGILVDLIPEPGEISQEGTPLNKATLLSEETEMKIWPDAGTRPAEPTVSEALSRILDMIEPVGTIKSTVRTDLGSNWILCNGAPVKRSALSDLIPLDVTKGWTNYGSDTPLIVKGERFLHDGGKLYVFNLSGNAIYLRSTTDIVSGFTSPSALSGITTAVGAGETIASLRGVMKCGAYYVLTFTVTGGGSRYCMAYATNINGPYTVVENQNQPEAPYFIGYTGSMYYYFVRHDIEGSKDSSDYTSDETMRFYHADTLAGLFASGCAHQDVFDANGGVGIYGQIFYSVRYAANDDFIAFSTEERGYRSSNGSHNSRTCLRLVDLRTPSNIKAVSAAYADNTDGIHKASSVFIVNGVFYGTVKEKHSSSSDAEYHFYKLTESSATKLNSKSTFSEIERAELHKGRLFLFRSDYVAILPASAAGDFYDRNINWIYHENGADLSAEGSGMIFAWDVFILQYNTAGRSSLCQAHLPNISIADGVYSYIRSD